MQTVLGRTTRKQFKSAPTAIQHSFLKRVALFQQNPDHPQLRNHPLAGKWHGHSSINITGDWRAIYRRVNEDTVLFVALGTHSELYG